MEEVFEGYAKLGNKIVRDFGLESHGTQSDKVHSMDTEKMSLSVLCRISEQMESLERLLTVASLDKYEQRKLKFNEIRAKLKGKFVDLLREREDKHGPCPQAISQKMLDAFMEMHAPDSKCIYNLSPFGDGWIYDSLYDPFDEKYRRVCKFRLHPPKAGKKTKTWRAYKAWMKRKKRD